MPADGASKLEVLKQMWRDILFVLRPVVTNRMHGIQVYSVKGSEWKGSEKCGKENKKWKIVKSATLQTKSEPAKYSAKPKRGWLALLTRKTIDWLFDWFN